MPAPLTSAEQLMSLVRRYRAEMARALASGGHRPVPPAANWVLLETVRRSGTVTEIAARLGVTKQAISRQGDQLVALGYCTRRRRRGNRREVLLSPTADGRRAASVLLDAIASVDATVLAALDQTDRAAFRRILASLVV